MANRRFTSQFSFSFEKQPVRLMGNITQSSTAGVAASRAIGGVTSTAILMGSAGNSITIAYVAGGTAGSEVVTVTGNAISVSIEAGVSSITQVRTAINASAAAALLVLASGTSASTVAAQTALPLQNGADATFSIVGLQGVSVSQTATGVYKILLPNTYKALIGFSAILKRAAAVDLMPQIVSEDVAAAKTIYVRMQAAATATNMAQNDVLFVSIELRNSSGLDNA